MSATPKTGERQVDPPDPWDPLIRISHWLIAGIVIYNGLISSEGSILHIWAGWIALAILLIRLGWGVLGPSPARFSSFPPDPRAAMSHLFSLMRGKVREYPSHNPAGALMVYALWASLMLVIVTGLAMTDGKSPLTIMDEKAAVARGDWSVLIEKEDGAHDDRDDGGQDNIVEDIHEFMANLLLFLAILHVVGVVLESRALGRNLVKPMLQGSK